MKIINEKEKQLLYMNAPNYLDMGNCDVKLWCSMYSVPKKQNSKREIDN